MEEQFEIRKDKLEKLKELGINVYPYSFDKSHDFEEIKSEFGNMQEKDFEEKEIKVSIAGRIVAIRKMGKSSFIHLFDGRTKLQIYIRKDMISEKEFQIFKLLDIGDIIGVKGRVFKTRTGELTVLVNELHFLTKSFHPLPEKWHGLQDKELRYRNRHLDLIVNDETRKIFKIRSELIKLIRLFFFNKGYTEVETPMMHPIPGGAAAKPFVTHHNALDIDLYLRVAPELYLKRLLVGGMEKIFEINRNFRNEGISLKHNPEFTMIEFYELYKDFEYYMNLTEELFENLNDKLLPTKEIDFENKKISLKTPFKRKKYMELIVEKSGINIDDLWNENKLSDFIKKNIPEEELPPTYGKMLELMFDYYVEKHLLEPTFVTHYPRIISPLSKVSREDERLTERFELYIAGMELANGFSELNDPFDQRKRFEAQVKDREKGDDEAHFIDNDFLYALEQGMPPAAGEGIGIDRLVMLYTSTFSIKEVILFPLLKPR